jgi:two-component sensor histidine kinase
VATSGVPLLLLDGDLDVIAASGSFCRAFHVQQSQLPINVFRLGAGEWDTPQLKSLLRTTLAGHAEIEAYEMDLDRPGAPSRRLVLNAQKLDYDDPTSVRLVITVLDVTDARATERLKDDAVREKELLLKELQHRIANSLQIIASVLLMSARRVQSDETRTHLYDAHNRVLSVASVQKQLAITRQGDVKLRPYLTELCACISASMIRDRDALKIELMVEDVQVNSDIAMSLGLVVTELVINALKHAFPGQRGGHIRIDYTTSGKGSVLTVADDGVGMPADAKSAPPGLGTSIIQALAKQLNATIKVAGNDPGTLISITSTGASNVPTAAV